MKLEYPDCPLCGDSEAREAYAFPPYGVRECRGCGFAFLCPRLTQEDMLKAYQDEAYFDDANTTGYEDYRSQEKALRLTFRRFLERLRQEGATGGDLLEVGCGLGFFLSEARSAFASLTATDYSSGALDQVDTDDVDLHLGGLAELPPERRFDCIVLIQVLEHIYDPIAELRTIHSKLRPDGSVVLAVPNYDSPLRALLGRRWPSFKIPEHVQYFERRSLRRALEAAGFSRIRELPYPHAFPLSLLLGKFGIKVPEWLGQLVLWIPTTCVAMVGRRSANGVIR